MGIVILKMASGEMICRSYECSPHLDIFFCVFLLIVLKLGFSEKATKFEKKILCTFDKSIVLCVRNSVLVKKSTNIFQNKCGQVVLYKL